MIEKSPSSPLGFAKADHSDPYRQLPLRHDQRELAAIALRDPSSGALEALLPSTQLFGSTTDAPRNNCLSRFIAALATRLLGIPVMGYFDDFGLAAPLPLTGDALQAFSELNDIFAFGLKLPKSEWGQIIESLGLMIELTLVPGSPPLFYLSQQTNEKPKTQSFEILEAGRASSAALQRLSGKPSLAQIAAMGKIDRSTFRPLYIQSNSDAAPRVLASSTMGALEWRRQALLAGLWATQIVKILPTSRFLRGCRELWRTRGHRPRREIEISEG